MTTIHRHAVMPHSAEDMFALVNNIEAYPGFLPWCQFARVHKQSADEVEATLGIRHGIIRKSFRTLNRLQDKRSIQMQLMEGPFKHLNGLWRFEPQGSNASRIALDMDFEMATPMLSLTLGPVFGHIARTLLDAFCKQADKVYG